MNPTVKRVLFTLLKFIVTAGILWFVLHRVDVAKLLQTLRETRMGWILPVGPVILLIIFLTAFRWRRILLVQGIHFSRFQACAINYIGAFFNSFMPGGTGGDVVKVIYAMRGAPEKKPQVLMTIVVDRLVGMAGLLGVIAVMLAVDYRVLLQERGLQSALVFCLTVMAAFLGAIALGCWKDLPRQVPLVGKIFDKLPMREKLVQLAEAYQVYMKAPYALAVAYGMSVLVHLSGVLITWLIAQALIPGGLPLRYLLLIVPIINLLSSIPVTLAGVGVRESLYVVFLGYLGVANETGFAVGFLVYGLTLLGALPGGIVYLLYRQESAEEPAGRK
ncbi:MAG: lysylphosphatidylglycerol synthase transmembrane domain-containing protein [Verrucomicrobiae bacterium]|nr:lysylphosphatidylglycerol synthase transmembrane domain-containing protein [Verrucomicrobiae bacterium]